MSEPIDFPEPSMIAVNGIELEVFEAGQENAGNPIVLCHGWPELAFSWRHQMGALAAAGYHVIAPNQRGFGNSSRPAEVSDYDIVHLKIANPGGGGFDEDFYVEGISTVCEPSSADYDIVEVTVDVSPQAYYTDDVFGD